MTRTHRIHAGEESRRPAGPGPTAEVVAWAAVAIFVLAVALAVGR